MSRKEAQQITSFFSSINIYWLLRKESAETTNLIYFFLGVQQRDFDGQRRLRKRYLKSEFALPQTL